MTILCGPKYLRNIVADCDGSCCGADQYGNHPQNYRKANREAYFSKHPDSRNRHMTPWLDDDDKPRATASDRRRVIDGVIVDGPLA